MKYSVPAVTTYNSPSSSSVYFLPLLDDLAALLRSAADGPGDRGEDEAGKESLFCLVGGDASSSEASPANASNSASRSSGMFLGSLVI